jgi:hypothetical protein
MDNTNTGFIILRHVNSELTNQYWITCYNSIRKYYKENPILIIDDNSDYRFITRIPLYKTSIILSEFPRRGELLPYYYYVRYKFCDTAVILHDSVFMNNPIDTNIVNYKMLWHFTAKTDPYLEENEPKQIEVFDDDGLTAFYRNRDLWDGCFGSMCIIKHSFLQHVNSKYDIGKLLALTTKRPDRCALERSLACIFQKEGGCKESLLGTIHNYVRWGITFHEKDYYRYLPLVKVWTGR